MTPWRRCCTQRRAGGGRRGRRDRASANSMRTTPDTLVEMAIDRPSYSRPASPLWGHETELALANFDVSGQPLPIEVVHALAAIKREAATVNGDGADGEQATRFSAIAAAAAEVEVGAHDEHFLIDIFQTGSGTSTNMNVNEVI